MNTVANAYVSTLGNLYRLLQKSRRLGPLSLEEEIEHPDAPDSLFQSLAGPYLAFTVDVLRIMLISHDDTDLLRRYAEQALLTLADDEGMDVKLLRTIWLTLFAYANGYAPRLACEFGRQAVPSAFKPSYQELAETLLAFDNRLSGGGLPVGQGNLDIAIDDFIDSLTADRGADNES